MQEYLRLMQKIDGRYLDEAYRRTAKPLGKQGKWRSIMGKTLKIAVSAAICIAAVAGTVFAIWKLKNAVDVSPNPNGSGNLGNAPETPKFHLSLPDITDEDRNILRIGQTFGQEEEYFEELLPTYMDYAYRRVQFYKNSYTSAAFTDKGWYSIGNPTEDSLSIGICYTEAATGKTVYLCAKPECLHNGNEYCPATNGHYDFLQLAMYQGELYALAVKNGADNNTELNLYDKTKPTETVLLRIRPDGTGLEELTTLDNRGAIDGEMIVYRGAVWVIGNIGRLVNLGDDAIAGSQKELRKYCGIWHYHLKSGKTTVIAANQANVGKSFGNLQADGDYVYFVKYNEYIPTGNGRRGKNQRYTEPDQLGGLERGLYRIDARTGAVSKLPQQPDRDAYMAVNGKLYWVTKTEGDSKNPDTYHLHTLENGKETEVRVPRGNHYYTDGTYLFIDLQRETLMICDMQGNQLKDETFTWDRDAINTTGLDYEGYCFGFGNGRIYRVLVASQIVFDPQGARDYYSSVPVADYLNGAGFKEDFVSVKILYFRNRN